MKKKAKALRIYEYTDPTGITFWSFSKLPGVSVRRLVLSSNVGTYYRKHIGDLLEWAVVTEDEELG